MDGEWRVFEGFADQLVDRDDQGRGPEYPVARTQHAPIDEPWRKESDSVVKKSRRPGKTDISLMERG